MPLSSGGGSVTGTLKKVTYNDTTLNEHKSEILNYLNTTNGGSLLSIGLKVKNNVSGNAVFITISDNTTKVSNVQGSLIKQNDFIKFYTTKIAGDYTSYNTTGLISDELILKIFQNYFKVYSNVNFDSDSSATIISGYSSVDVSDIQLDTLIIEYFE